MVITLIVNDAPYGLERTYNAMRLALELQKDEEVELRLFLMGDAVSCALKEQLTPQGYYNIGRMIKRIAEKSLVSACVTCINTRGIKEEYFLEGVKAGDLAMIAEWVKMSDKVINF